MTRDEYHAHHARCPKCLSDDIEQTTAGPIEIPGKPYQDNVNDARCQSPDCGWSGKVSDLQPRSHVIMKDFKTLSEDGADMKYLDKQRYSECQVVTAINAWICLTHPTLEEVEILLESKYEALIDLAGARNGSALSIGKVHDELGIDVSKHGFKFLHDWESAGYPLPIEVSVWHPRYGCHSVCCVEFLRECSALKVLNFRHETTCDGSWIFRERFDPWVTQPGFAQNPFPIKLLKKKDS